MEEICYKDSNNRNMIKVALIRGSYLNNFEGQNYIFDKNIHLTAFSSLKPLNAEFPFSVVRLLSLSDFQKITFLKKPVKILANRLFGDSQNLFGLEKYASRFDIFHTADPHYYYSYQLAKLRQGGLIKRLISTSWEIIPYNNETVARKKFIKKFTQKYVDLFICYTQKAKDCLVKEGIAESKIKVVTLGVDLNKFQVKSSKLKAGTQSCKLLFVGRAVEEKGIYDLKQAVAGLKNISLKIVEFGSRNYQKMPEIYQQADILVLPSKKTKTWEEQYGMVLVEAMASAIPIVAYETGAISEIVQDAGILIPQDTKKLHDAIKYLAGNFKQREKLGKIGRKRAEIYFDAKKTAKSLAKIYEHLSRNNYQ